LTGSWASFQQATAQASLEAHERRTRRLYEGYEIPPKYADLTWDGFLKEAGDDTGKRMAILSAQQYMEKGFVLTRNGPKRSVLVWGPPGVGKTGGYTPMWRKMADGQPALWISLLDLTNAINEGYRNKAQDAYEKLNAARTVPWLFLDDVGDLKRASATEGMNNHLSAIIWHRDAQKLPTVMTSNLKPTQMSSYFTEALYQRIAEMAAVIEMGGRILRKL
jgi:DNA replication protein DnaC